VDAVREKQALTTGEVAKFCGVNFRTVIRWIERGHLQAYKLPGRGDNRIPVSGFVEFLKDNHMPVPDELLLGGKTLVFLSDDSPACAEIASLVRRSGWEVMMTSDAIQFGFLISERQPAAVAVSRVAAQQSVERLLRDQDGRETLFILIDSGDADGASDHPVWTRIAWPRQSTTLAALLSGEGSNERQ
jgi:excisionase family DNA binding protein